MKTPRRREHPLAEAPAPAPRSPADTTRPGMIPHATGRTRATYAVCVTCVIPFLIVGCASRSATPTSPAEASPATQTPAAEPTTAAAPAQTSAPAHTRANDQQAPSTPATASTPAGSPAEPVGPREVFPGVRVDRAARLIEFDGVVPIDTREGRRVFLELLVCPRDTKEHEALVVTDARPSHVHAALLLLGLEPGSPGLWSFDGPTLVATPPTGPALVVRFVLARDGQRVEEDPATWVRSLNDGKSLRESMPADGLVFAGSRMRRVGNIERYHADMEGTLVGLTTFGSELIAWTRMVSHEAGVETPHWIADPRVVPPPGTPVTVRIRPADLRSP